MMPFSQAVRSLFRSPGFALLAIATLGLGVGSATAIFTVVDAVLLEPLAFQNPGHLVSINTVWPKKDHSIPRVTGGDFVDIRTRAHAFSALSTYAGGDIAFSLGGHAHFASIFFVDPDFFNVLAIAPALGRLPDGHDANRSALVAASFANQNFGAGAQALGRTLEVDNKDYEIVGIVPDPLAFPEKAGVWIVGPATPENLSRSAFNYHAIARVKGDTTLGTAQAELTVIGARLAAAYAASNADKTFAAIPLRDQLAGPARTTLYFLAAAVGLLLLIASANVANLMLARGTQRSREIAIRTALGARAREILSMLLGESATLAIASGAVGLFLAWVEVQALLPLIPVNVPRVHEGVHLNLAVLCFAVLVSLAATVLAGIAPATQALRRDVIDYIKQAPSRGFVGARSGSRNALVVVEIALCFVLCAGAGLLVRTLLGLTNANLGFRTENVLVMYADAPAFHLPEYLSAIRTFENSLDEIRRIPGVLSSAAAMGLPLGQYGSNGGYLIEGKNIVAGQDPFKMDWPQNVPQADFALTSRGYFSTMNIPLLDGRDFNARDQYDAPFTAIVSASLAKESFPNESPIGKRIYCGLDSPKPMKIVGVVGDVRQNSPGARPGPEIYMPFQQHPFHANELQLAIRTALPPDTLIADVRSTMRRTAPGVAIKFTTVEAMKADSLSAPRFRAILMLIFAGLAAGLALAGVYGVMALFVAQRTAEIGIRVALGAQPGSIVTLVLRQAMVLAVGGALLGCAGALLLSKFAASLLYEVRPLDPWAYIVAALVALAVACGAALLPALRAVKLDPLEALRAE